MKNPLKFIQEELHKTGIKNAICGLSGGIDSAVVAVLAKESGLKLQSIILTA